MASDRLDETDRSHYDATVRSLEVLVSTGEKTKQHIVEQAAGLFNRKGFAGTSMSDLMDATGLQKGGIYRHFVSKEELAVEGFNLAIKKLARRFEEAIRAGGNASERLRGVIDVYADLPVSPPVPGGCPVLTAAVDSHNGPSPLRPYVREAVDRFRRMVRLIVSHGVERGEVRPKVDPDRVATVITATMEGAIMMTQLYDDADYVQAAASHLGDYLSQSVFT